MPVQQKEVIDRLRAGETIVHVIERVNGQHKPFQYLSRGGQGNRCHVSKTDRSREAIIEACQCRSVSGGRTAGMGVA